MKTLLFVGVLLASASMVFAESTNVAAKAQTSCPVMGGAVNHKIFVDYQGQRIYFCCNGCTADFNKDPEKYIKKLKADGVALEKVK